MLLLSVQPIIERLKALDKFAEVGGVAQFSRAEEMRQTVPAAFVLPLDNEAQRINGELSRYSNAVSQYIHDTFAVIIIARNVSDARGEAAIEELAALREAVVNSLVGWVPPGASCELLYRRGRLEKFNDQTVFWRDEYITAHDLEK